MADVRDVPVPDIGDFTDVPVIEVLVAVGDTVEPEQPLVTLESDKATMDVPAPFGGKVAEILVEEGAKVSEGTLLVRMEVSGDGGPPAGEAEDAGGSGDDSRGGADADDAPTAQGASGGDGSPSGSAQTDAVVAAEDAEGGDAPERASEEKPVPARDQPGYGASGDTPSGDGPPYASPAVRRMARERGVDLSSVRGTGRKGRITKEDVEKAASGARQEPTAAPAAEPGADEERVELTRIKRISGPRLQAAWQEIPHVTHHDEADITDLEAFRKAVNAEQDDVKVTMVALIMKALIPSLKAFPEVNASLDGDHLILKRRYHLGFAADTPQGLLVPVIRDVDRKGLLQIAAELAELSGRARAGKIKGEELQGATFTISSLGGIGGTGFTPIVNPPQVGILGVTRSATKPVWDGGEFVPRLMVPLSFSYDHRVIDGAAAARFVVHLKGVLEDMRRVLL